MPRESPVTHSEEYDLVVAGGGAAGFFGAITCAEKNPEVRIVIVEKKREVLGKVRISGGGRCNVTHACFDSRELSGYYPRGSRQLIGPLHRWGPADTMAWFEDRGVPLKIEADNRVFPQSDQSQSIIDCLTETARRAGITVLTERAIESVSGHGSSGYVVVLEGGSVLRTRNLLLTTGGTRNRIGADIAAGFGHRIEPAAPSLFTFKIDDSRLEGLQGLSVSSATVRVEGINIETAAGPVLVTHWGLSGPAILRLSAWGARALQRSDYRFEVVVNWCGGVAEGELVERFDRLRTESPRRIIVNDPQFDIPARLWKRLVESAAGGCSEKIDVSAMRWPHLPREFSRRLAAELSASRFAVEGKSMNKEEFVTCGGVCLDEVHFKTMQSRKIDGLYFAGEVLDIDGITGGFNFQSAWTTGRIAGEAIAAAIG